MLEIEQEYFSLFLFVSFSAIGCLQIGKRKKLHVTLSIGCNSRLLYNFPTKFMVQK